MEEQQQQQQQQQNKNKNKRVYLHYENDGEEGISKGLPDFTSKLELQSNEVVPIHSLLEV